MKIRVTFMTENDKSLNKSKDEIEKLAKETWNMACELLTSVNPEEKITLEKCELIED